jgi:hypothetical protein
MTQRNSTIGIDREVLRQAKILCAQERVTLKWFAETSMLAYMTRWPRSTVPQKNKEPLSSS